jgi:hypothetical protein
MLRALLAFGAAFTLVAIAFNGGQMPRCLA